MYKTFLIKYAEIAIKGKNRYIFEDALVKNIKYQLRNVDGSFEVRKESGRVYVETDGDYDYDETVATLSRIFGIVGICPVELHEDEGFDKLCEAVIEHINHVYKNKSFTFKVNARRARKNYPMTSMEINAAVGEKVLEAFPETRVDVHNPQVMINIEIRPMINIYSEEIPGPGGMPLGTAGKAMLLLSGGIDSPVAGYMIAKRGVVINATYFHAPPYTSERAKQKVVDAKSLKDWRTGRSVFGNVIPSTTGAAKAVGLVIPSLKGKMTGISYRVPTADVSVIDVNVVLNTPTSGPELRQKIKEASETYLKGVLEYVDDEVVSGDFVGDPCTSIFDSRQTIELNDHFFKLIAYYDNEFGYSSNLLNMLKYMHSVDNK